MAADKRTAAEAELDHDVGAVGRLVDSSQADDRRIIRLVQARPLLYARNNMPVASYYAQVKKLWEQVAEQMGWTVAEVRRKWSHIRNSYSRHLRNEMYGARTGRGRAVSRWYLADDLRFLREHMATDMRPARYSSATLYPSVEVPTSPKQAPTSEPVEIKPFLSNPWLSALTSQGSPEPAPMSHVPPEEPSSPRSFEPDENAAYFQFFRGIYNDYQELPARKQRLFRRECLGFLHHLLDEEEGAGGSFPTAVNLCSSALDSDDEREKKSMIIRTVTSLPP